MQLTAASRSGGWVPKASSPWMETTPKAGKTWQPSHEPRLERAGRKRGNAPVKLTKTVSASEENYRSSKWNHSFGFSCLSKYTPMQLFNCIISLLITVLKIKIISSENIHVQSLSKVLCTKFTLFIETGVSHFTYRSRNISVMSVSLKQQLNYF